MKQAEFNRLVIRIQASLDRAEGANKVFQRTNNDGAKWGAGMINDELEDARCALQEIRRAEVRQRSK